MPSVTSGVTLHRTDPARNMWRYYRLDIQRDLFGAWCFIGKWVAMGRRGRYALSLPHPGCGT